MIRFTISDSTLTSFANSFSLASDFCTNILWAKVEHDGKASLIDITGNVHSVPCTYIDCQALSILRCLHNIGNEFKGIMILCETSFWLILTDRFCLHHLLSCSSLFCHQISVKYTKQALVATSEVTSVITSYLTYFLCNSFFFLFLVGKDFFFKRQRQPKRWVFAYCHFIWG